MIQPLNSPLEVGLRALFVLADQYPASINIDTLTILDYYLVHSGEFRGPDSAFPNLPDRLGELGVKRGLLQDGLHLMQVIDLAQAELTASGLAFRATESTTGFLDLLTEDLAAVFRSGARWLSEDVIPSLRADGSLNMADLLNDWRFRPGERAGQAWGHFRGESA